MTITEYIKKYSRDLFHNDMGWNSKWEYAYLVSHGAITKHKGDQGFYHAYHPTKYKRYKGLIDLFRKGLLIEEKEYSWLEIEGMLGKDKSYEETIKRHKKAAKKYESVAQTSYQKGID